MADDIEAFLRRAAERRAAKQAQRGRAPQSPPTVRKPPRPVPVVVEAELVSEDVATHVTRRMESRQFTERAQRLGETVGLADEKLESHLQQRFDHQLGQIDSGGPAAQARGAGPPPEAALPLGLQIAALVHSPGAIRQAVVLAEILQRPEHRW